jgi:hypothetical protein
MNKIAAGLAIAGILLFAGCATELNFSEVRKSLPAVPAHKGRIFVYRPSLDGAATPTDVKLNGSVIGAAFAGGAFYIDRLAGNYTAETTSEATRPLSFTLSPGQTRYVRIDAAMGYLIVRLYPELVDPKTAEGELTGCNLISGSP